MAKIRISWNPFAAHTIESTCRRRQFDNSPGNNTPIWIARSFSFLFTQAKPCCRSGAHNDIILQSECCLFVMNGDSMSRFGHSCEWDRSFDAFSLLRLNFVANERKKYFFELRNFNLLGQFSFLFFTFFCVSKILLPNTFFLFDAVKMSKEHCHYVRR